MDNKTAVLLPDENEEVKEILPEKPTMRYTFQRWSKNQGSKKKYNFKQVKRNRKISDKSKRKNRGK